MITVVTHELKVVPPYFDSLVSGVKTFEVRKNDRAYQRDDLLSLREWHPYQSIRYGERCGIGGCQSLGPTEHWHSLRETVVRRVTFVYAGDPRFGGIEAGFVVLGLGRPTVTA